MRFCVVTAFVLMASAGASTVTLDYDLAGADDESPDWTLEGDAAWRGGGIALNEAATERSGAAYYSVVRVDASKDWVASFDAQVLARSSNGADGFAFALLDSDTGTTGIDGGAADSFMLVFDTYFNSDGDGEDSWDSDATGLEVFLGEGGPDYTQSFNTDALKESDDLFSVDLAYTAANTTLEVTFQFDGGADYQVFTFDSVDLSALTDVSVAFQARTGGQYEAHDIHTISGTFGADPVRR